MATIKELADQMYAQFEKRTRDNGRAVSRSAWRHGAG